MTSDLPVVPLLVDHGLMEHLPPVGWADVATKRDLDVLSTQIEALGDRLRAEFQHEHKGLLVAMIGVNLTTLLATASLAFAAARWS